MRTLQRLLLWGVVTVGLVFWTFQAGVESYDREHCTPDATDCDLGFLRGGPWAVLAFLGMLAVIVCVEVWLVRRRLRSQDEVTEETHK